MSSQRDNIKAGLFVLLGIVLALVIVFALTDLQRLFEIKQNVKVFYQLSDGLKGLKNGAAVTLGGQPVGEVTQIEDRLDETGSVDGKLVTVSLPKRIKIYQNAMFELDRPAFGSGTKLNIRYVGEGALYDGTTPIPGDIAGSELTQQFTKNMGIEDLQRQQIKNIIANVEAITGKLRESVPQLVDKLHPILDNATAATENIKTITADVRDRRKVWFDRIDGITEKADQSLTSVRDLLRDKDPQIRGTIDNVEEITSHVREKTMAQVDDALTKAQVSLDNLKTATEQVKIFVIGQRPVLERALANAQLTTDQLKLAAIEIRRSPWRLLYKPGDEELETDNLYDAARSFALAAGTLDAAAQSLQAVANQQPQNNEQINAMLEHLEKLFARYEEAEKEFWDALKGKKPPVE